MIKLLNAHKLQALTPAKILSCEGFDLYEHPTLGDGAPVIADMEDIESCFKGLVEAQAYMNPDR